jgi:hypothetical protein
MTVGYSMNVRSDKGPTNVPRLCPVGCVRVVGEDADVESYELKDGEETPVVSEDDSVYPVGKTFVQKDGPNTII